MPRMLFERLRGPRGGTGRAGPQREHLESSDQVLHSILENLQRLLNSRQGESQACPDYGILDLSQILYGLPDNQEAVERAMQKCIEQYEPRLTRVRVKRVEDPSRPLTICFLVSARLAPEKNQNDVWFETVVASSGRVRVVRG